MESNYYPQAAQDQQAAKNRIGTMPAGSIQGPPKPPPLLTLVIEALSALRSELCELNDRLNVRCEAAFSPTTGSGVGGPINPGPLGCQEDQIKNLLVELNSVTNRYRSLVNHLCDRL